MSIIGCYVYLYPPISVPNFPHRKPVRPRRALCPGSTSVHRNIALRIDECNLVAIVQYGTVITSGTGQVGPFPDRYTPHRCFTRRWHAREPSRCHSTGIRRWRHSSNPLGLRHKIGSSFNMWERWQVTHAAQRAIGSIPRALQLPDHMSILIHGCSGRQNVNSPISRSVKDLKIRRESFPRKPDSFRPASFRTDWFTVSQSPPSHFLFSVPVAL